MVKLIISRSESIWLLWHTVLLYQLMVRNLNSKSRAQIAPRNVMALCEAFGVVVFSDCIVYLLPRAESRRVVQDSKLNNGRNEAFWFWRHRLELSQTDKIGQFNRKCTFNYEISPFVTWQSRMCSRNVFLVIEQCPFNLFLQFQNNFDITFRCLIRYFDVETCF